MRLFVAGFFSLVMIVLQSASSIAVSSEADDCTTVPNLAENLGPPSNQHCTNWCYNFTATDMITQKLQKTGKLKPNERIHPFAVAGATFLAHGLDPSSEKATGGLPERAFWAVNTVSAKKLRLCLETDLGPDTGNHNLLFQRSADEAMAAFKDSIDKPSSDICEATLRSEMSLQTVTEHMKAASRQSWVDTLSEKCHTDPPVFSSKSYGDDERFAELTGPKHVPPNTTSAKKMGQTLDYALEHQSIAAVLMDFSFLKDPHKNKPTAAQTACHESLKAGGNVALHVVSVVSRRRNEAGVCEYLLRNSWGTSCDGFIDKEKCKNGYHWIPRDQLLQKISRVEYLE